MPSMHPAWRHYRFPNLSETMLAGGAAAAALAAAGLLDPWPAAAWPWRCAERTAIGRFRAPASRRMTVRGACAQRRAAHAAPAALKKGAGV